MSINVIQPPKSIPTTSTLVYQDKNTSSILPTNKNSQSDSTILRSSSLQSPIMLLTGHEDEVNSCVFSPNGQYLASCSNDTTIFLWNVYGDCENICVLRGHTAAVIEICFSDEGENLISCSVDKTLAVWDLETGERVRRLKGHTSYINSCAASKEKREMAVSGSDDGTVLLWDTRQKNPTHSFNCTYQVTAVECNTRGDQIYSAGIDNFIRIWDTRNTSCTVLELHGHTDTVTSLCISPNGHALLSNSMDNTVRNWDIRPFVSKERLIKVYLGVQHTFEKKLLGCSWTPDGIKVSAGSGDRFVYVWDAITASILYKLPGHSGSVNGVDFHPLEPILLSCSSDKKLYMGELLI